MIQYKKHISKLILLILLFFFCYDNSSYGQPKRYVVIKGGFGLPYGAYGLNAEYRFGKFGGYMGAGYMKPQYYADIDIPSSYNGAFGLKYYFFRTQDLWHPVLGIHAGWLNNYYHRNIGKSSYDPTVYGLALIIGVEMIEEMMSLEMSMVIDPGVAVFKPETHPNYTDKVYFTPTVGVGVNLYALKMYFKNRERKKVREEKKLEEKEIINEKTSDFKEITYSTKDTNVTITEKIIRECNDTLNFPAVKIFTVDKDGMQWIGKQIADDVFIFVKCNDPITGIERKLHTYKLDSTSKSQSVFILKTIGINEKLSEITQKLMNKERIYGEIYNCNHGLLKIYSYGNSQNEISVQLNDLKLVNGSNSELYYDEITICLLSGKKK